MKLCDVAGCGKTAAGYVRITPPYAFKDYQKDLCEEHAEKLKVAVNRLLHTGLNLDKVEISEIQL